MAEEHNPVTHGELVEIVRRLDDRISSMDRSIDERFQAVGERLSSMDRNLDNRFQAVNQNLTEMRMDIRMLTRAMIGFYAFIVASVGVAFTLYKLFPNP